MRVIAGIWELARSGGSLGTLLILLEELEIQRRIYGADRVDVHIVRDARRVIDAMSRRQAADFQWPSTGNAAIPASIVAAVRGMSGIAECHVWSDSISVQRAMRRVTSNCVMWPNPEMLLGGGHNYDSTLVIQEYFERKGEIPRLSVNTKALTWADAYLREKAGGRWPVAMHLKNNPSALGQSNANMASWLSFISHCARKHPVQFVLIGDDTPDPRLRDFPNVTIGKDDYVTLVGHLALIQTAGMFMGMMSGPANMALFGKNPYVIFKNPDHHAQEMMMGMGDHDRYRFALEHQRVLRAWDTPGSLIAAFENCYGRVTDGDVRTQ